MAKLVQFQTPDGGTAVVAVLSPGDDVQAVSLVSDAIEKVQTNLADVLSMIRGVATSFSDALRDAPVESAQVELGVQFTAKGNVYVVGAEANAAIKVTLSLSPSASWGGSAHDANHR